jgi:hypothetical protein
MREATGKKALTTTDGQLERCRPLKCGEREESGYFEA